MEVVQKPHRSRGAGGVPIRADALQLAAHPAPPAAASLLLNQLLP